MSTASRICVAFSINKSSQCALLAHDDLERVRSASPRAANRPANSGQPRGNGPRDNHHNFANLAE
jgi:hypothetical protein